MEEVNLVHDNQLRSEEDAFLRFIADPLLLTPDLLESLAPYQKSLVARHGQQFIEQQLERHRHERLFPRRLTEAQDYKDRSAYLAALKRVPVGWRLQCCLYDVQRTFTSQGNRSSKRTTLHMSRQRDVASKKDAEWAKQAGCFPTPVEKRAMRLQAISDTKLQKHGGRRTTAFTPSERKARFKRDHPSTFVKLSEADRKKKKKESNLKEYKKKNGVKGRSAPSTCLATQLGPTAAGSTLSDLDEPRSP